MKANMSLESRVRDFVKERNEALFSLDRQTIEAYFKKRGLQTPKNEIVFWAGVYKSICNITDAPQELVDKSKAWLHEHGMSAQVVL